MKKILATLTCIILSFLLWSFSVYSDDSIMTHAEYMAADLDSYVTVVTAVQAHQSWWDNKLVVYAQSEDGAYYIYNMRCTKEQADKLVPGTMIKVSGYKSEWSGEIEIVDADFEIVDGHYIAPPTDVTSLLGTSALITHQNEYISAKGLVVSNVYFKNGEPGDDIYITFNRDGITLNFMIEAYLTEPETKTYSDACNLNVGDTIDIEGFLFWYNGPNVHITSISPVNTDLSHIIASGTCGQDVSWVLSDAGVLTLDGTGATDDYESCNAPWENLKDSINTVLINQGIVKIGSCLFADCENLSYISIPASVYSVGASALRGTSIRVVNLPTQLEELGDACFYGCALLESIVIPDGTSSIGKNCFAYCTGLMAASLSKSITEVPSGCFSHCSQLSKIILPTSIARLGEFCFDSCINLKMVIFLGNAPSISSNSFVNVNATIRYSTQSTGWESISGQHYSGNLLWEGLSDPLQPIIGSVMTHAEYMAADLDSYVTVVTAVQAHQSWWDNKLVVYAQSEDGAYYIYNMRCTKEQADKLVPGTMIKVSGYKSEWPAKLK